MKSSNKTLTRMLLAGASLIVTSSALAEESAAEPQIAICEMFPADEPTDIEVTFKDTLVDDEILPTEDEVVIDDPEITTDVVVDKNPDDGTDVFVTWLPEWTYRTTDGKDIPLSSTGEPADAATDFTVEVLSMQSGAAAGDSSSAPQAADEASAVIASISKNTVSAKIQRVASKPAVVKANGRVFLR